MSAGAIYKRSPALVNGILEVVREAGGEPVGWNDLCDRFAYTGEWPFKTIENVLYDLVAFGALHRIGKAVGHRDTRAVRMSELGTAWLDREVLELVGGDVE